MLTCDFTFEFMFHPDGTLVRYIINYSIKYSMINHVGLLFYGVTWWGIKFRLCSLSASVTTRSPKHASADLKPYFARQYAYILSWPGPPDKGTSRQQCRNMQSSSSLSFNANKIINLITFKRLSHSDFFTVWTLESSICQRVHSSITQKACSFFSMLSLLSTQLLTR
jgi:hypothetical protein